MFTGIVQGTGIVVKLNTLHNLTQVGVTVPPSLSQNIQQGASVSIDGVCLTVVGQEGNTFYFDIVAETLNCTTFRNLYINQVVNIERALKMGDELGGHLLSGHVMGIASVTLIEKPTPEQSKLFFTWPEKWMCYIIPKGFIAINGVSLTVVDTDPSGIFSVHLIPETLATTNLSALKVTAAVNIEIDYQTQVLVQTVQRFLATQKI